MKIWHCKVGAFFETPDTFVRSYCLILLTIALWSISLLIFFFPDTITMGYRFANPLPISTQQPIQLDKAQRVSVRHTRNVRSKIDERWVGDEYLSSYFHSVHKHGPECKQGIFMKYIIIPLELIFNFLDLWYPRTTRNLIFQDSYIIFVSLCDLSCWFKYGIYIKNGFINTKQAKLMLRTRSNLLALVPIYS